MTASSSSALARLEATASSASRTFCFRPVERKHVRVELAFPEAIAARSLVDAGARFVALRAEGQRAGLEFGPGFDEPLDLGCQGDGAFDQGRVIGSGFGSAMAEIFGGLARLEQTALRRRQPVVGCPLLVFETRDRLARFDLAAVDGFALLLGLPAFTRELLALLVETRRFVHGVLQLRVLRDDGLFLLVVLGCQCSDGVGRLGDGGVKGRGFLGKAGERVVLGLDPRA
jgi:hypothetical protein